jgi:predicted nucleotidyltransferase component of viral defense system
MAHSMMTLHTNSKDFAELIQLAATQFNIAPEYIEKDYWITLVLNRLSHSAHAESVVFKGGTSLAKGYRLINRFSEDIDIATINENLSGNALKTEIRAIEKNITSELTEIIEPELTSKGSMFRKSIFQYPRTITNRLNVNVQKRIIVEINSFANPYPYISQNITSFIADFLLETNQPEAIEQYGLQPFSLNVLDKRRTMIEKLVSLIRFSFSEKPNLAIASKIRHFYDLFYLMNDAECAKYVQSSDFLNDLSELLVHDQLAFNEPLGWQTKTIAESPLVTTFPSLWEALRLTYQTELSLLAFETIPDEKLVEDSFMKIIQRLL